MARIKVSKSLIISIAEKGNEKFVKNINKKVNQIFSSAIDRLSNQISYVSIKNIIFQPVNELFSGAMVDSSSFTYFLGVDNAQLELNTINKTPFWKHVKEEIKFAWQNRNTFKKKKKRKKKKNQEEVIQPAIKFDPEKYNVYNLTQDLQDTVIQYLSETSLVYISDNMLKIIGKDDFGSNTAINVFIVNLNEDKYKFYAGRKKGFIDIDINTRFKFIDDKINQVGENFIKILKIFNMLYYNANRELPNQVFMESILCYIPNDLYKGKDIYSVFVKIINYISLKSLKNIVSINNPSKNILEDNVCGKSYLGFNRMLNSITDKDL